MGEDRQVFEAQQVFVELDAFRHLFGRTDQDRLVLQRLVERGNQAGLGRLAVLAHVSPAPAVGAEKLPELVVAVDSSRSSLLIRILDPHGEDEHPLLARGQRHTMDRLVLLAVNVPEAFDERVVLVPEHGTVANHRHVSERRRAGDGLPDLVRIQGPRDQRQGLHGRAAVRNARHRNLEMLT